MKMDCIVIGVYATKAYIQIFTLDLFVNMHLAKLSFTSGQYGQHFKRFLFLASMYMMNK